MLIVFLSSPYTCRLKQIDCPAALLWGCSSGHLASRGVHDPAGTALTYLRHGAAFVVGNLWDITDRDIDRLSISCMQQIFTNDANNGIKDLSSALISSRDVCKLKWAVGGAPVLYGLPTSFTSI